MMEKFKNYLVKIDDVIASGKYKDSWESLAQWSTPEWYKQGRFGIFIHWGVYSVAGVENEWYPRWMYMPGHKSYTHRINTYGKDFEYSQLIPMFKPEKFDPNKWCELFKKAGARHVMPVVEHHDGVKMYDTDLSRWNMMALNGRDYSMEIKKACEDTGLEFLASHHRAEHYWFMNTATHYEPSGEVAINEQLRDLYGPAFAPENGKIHKTDKHITAPVEWLEDWLVSLCDMLDRLQPSAIYLDWWVQKSEFRPYMRKFMAYYYNRAIEWGKEVTLFYKWGAVMNGCATFDVERGQVDNILPDLWQNDTSMGKRSWGFTYNNTFKNTYDIITNMIEVFSKNGCYMLNVGPTPEGEICKEEEEILLDIGKWLEINGEAIYGSGPFELGFGEGKMSKNGAFKESKRFSIKDYRYTYRTGVIYAFPMSNKNGRSTYSMKLLRRANENGIKYDITSIKILGSDVGVTFKQNGNSLDITTDEAIISKLPICFKICVD